MAEIEFTDVQKVYDDGTQAVHDLDLAIEDGELMVLVGPSGCGKTTALRMVAGLEEISDGEIRIGDQIVNDLTPKERNIAMVFQSYALYPHMTVEDNLAFSLKLSKLPKKEVAERVQRAAHILQIEDFLKRKPRALSGGQRQRVAMGRAIVREPQAFLMDEPLSNLDAKLRVQMRAEVARLQHRLGTTTIYVTHDQVEAMTLGDRVAVMRSGIVQQTGPPQELYEDPVNLFVAGFIGSPSMNFVPAEVDGDTVKLPMVEAKVPDALRGHLDVKMLAAGIRPEHFEDASLVGDKADKGATFRTKIEVIESMGSELYAHFSLEKQGLESEELRELAEESGAGELREDEEDIIVARLDAASKIRAGQEAELWLDASKLHFFDVETGRALNGKAASTAGATA